MNKSEIAEKAQPLTYEQEVHAILCAAAGNTESLLQYFEAQAATETGDAKKLTQKCIDWKRDDLRRIRELIPKAERERAIAESQAPHPWDIDRYSDNFVELGDGEPSPAPLAEAKELFELYLGVSKSSDVNTYVDWYKRVNDWLKRNFGAAQEVSPRPVSAESPNVTKRVIELLHADLEKARGDTRELKAALKEAEKIVLGLIDKSANRDIVIREAQRAMVRWRVLVG